MFSSLSFFCFHYFPSDSIPLPPLTPPPAVLLKFFWLLLDLVVVVLSTGPALLAPPFEIPLFEEEGTAIEIGGFVLVVVVVGAVTGLLLSPIPAIVELVGVKGCCCCPPCPPPEFEFEFEEVLLSLFALPQNQEGTQPRLPSSFIA